VNNELHQSQELADVAAIPHSDDMLHSENKCLFYVSKIEDTFPERRGVTDSVRSDLQYRLLLHLA
jgi:hypothetical protein